MIKSPIKWVFKDFQEIKKEVLDLGFIRFSVWENIYTINDEVSLQDVDNLTIVIDRLVDNPVKSVAIRFILVTFPYVNGTWDVITKLPLPANPINGNLFDKV